MNQMQLAVNMESGDLRSQESSRERPFDPLEFFSNIPEISEKILSPLSVPELRKCGRVSRLWRQNVAILFSTRNCYAYITRNCKEIVKTAGLMSSLQYCLINSVKIDIPFGHSQNCNFTPNAKQRKAVHDNFMALPIRILDIHVGVCLAANSLLRQALLGASGTLEELNLTYCKDAIGGDITHSVRKTFGKLRVINIRTLHGWPPEDAFNLIRLAPSLRAVNGLFQLEDVALNKCSGLELLTGLYILPCRNDNALKPVLQRQPKLTELLLCDIGTRTIPQSWISDLCQLLCLWSGTLKRLSVCAFTVLKLLPNMLPLQNLDFLELFFPEDSSPAQFANMMARLKLHLSCPAVTSIRLMFDTDFCSHELPPSYSENLHDFPPSLSIREVTTEKAICMPAVMGTCITLFPKIFSFSFESLQCTEICEIAEDEHLYDVYKIWTDIPNLERLKICVVDLDVSPRNYTLDALFCGISAAEARTIKQNHQRGRLELKNFQYGPIRPALNCAQKLQEITVVLSGRYTYKTFCISEVAGTLVFARNPHLRLVIESHCSDASSDVAVMAQFGKIVTTSDLDEWC